MWKDVANLLYAIEHNFLRIKMCEMYTDNANVQYYIAHGFGFVQKKSCAMCKDSDIILYDGCM
jgi:hypothetical protein